MLVLHEYLLPIFQVIAISHLYPAKTISSLRSPTNNFTFLGQL